MTDAPYPPPSPPGLFDADRRALIASRSHEQLVDAVFALQRDWPEDEIRGMSDRELAGVSEALSQQRLLVMDRARFVQALQDQRAAEDLERRRAVLTASSPLLSPEGIADTSNVGGRPADG